MQILTGATVGYIVVNLYLNMKMFIGNDFSNTLLNIPPRDTKQQHLKGQFYRKQLPAKV